MLKKLSISLAFLGKPEVILLDEPLITIDSGSLEVLYEWIKFKHIREHVSFILASHQSLEESHLEINCELIVRDGGIICLQ